jgi:hypothetical protein
MISMKLGTSKMATALMALVGLAASLGPLLPAHAQDGGGLGSVSSCPAAAEIAAAATIYALSNDSGLTSRQASALLTTTMRQLSMSAPEQATALNVAAMKALQQVVLDSAAAGKTPQSDLSHDQVAALPPEEAITTPDGYRKMTKAVIQGGVDGAMSMGFGAEGLQALVTAVTISMVQDAGTQAALAVTQNKTGENTKFLPMSDAETAKDVTSLIVSTIVEVALRAGFTDKEISTAINKAAADATEAADKIGDLLAAQSAAATGTSAATSVANEVASAVAKETAAAVAKAVAAEIKNHVDTKIQPGAQDPEAVTDTLSTPGVGTRDTLPTAPGQAIIPGVNVPPQNLSPLPTPTPKPTPTPTPKPTPTPASPR